MPVVVDEDVGLTHASLLIGVLRVLRITHTAEVSMYDIFGMEVFKTLGDFEQLNRRITWCDLGT
jgi:hypothetical protein